MYGKAITALLIVGGAAYASSSVLQDFLQGTLNMVSITAAKTEMDMIHDKFTEFRIAHERYPNRPELLSFLKQEFEEGLDSVLSDPWKSLYLLLGPKVEILSMGPDKKALTRDDLVVDYPSGVNPPSWAASGNALRGLR